MSGQHSRWEDGKAAARRRASRAGRDPIAEARAADQAAAEHGRREAANAGDPWAEPVDLGVPIDPGAPLPHLLADGLRTVLVFHAGLDLDPGWDGTTVMMVHPAADIAPAELDRLRRRRSRLARGPERRSADRSPDHDVV